MAETKNIQWYLDRGLVVPGSGEDVAMRQRERRKMQTENEIREAAKVTPAFGRMLDAINEKSPAKGDSRGLDS